MRNSWKRWPTPLLFCCCFASLPSLSADCSYYVSADRGNDVNAGDRSRPLKTIQAAADKALTPGNVVCVEPGVYFENTQSYPSAEIKGIKVRAGGTRNRPIVFQKLPGSDGAVVIDQRHDYSRAPGASVDARNVVGFYIRGHDHVTIRGFEIVNVGSGILTKALNQPKAGFLGEYDPPRYVRIENNHIHQVRRFKNRRGFDSNVAAVQPDDCYDCSIIGNRLHDVGIVDQSGRDLLTNQNSAAVHSFGMFRTVINGNEIYDVHTGVYHKSWTKQPLPGDPAFRPTGVPPQPDRNRDFGIRVSRNLIHDTIWGVRLASAGGAGRVIAKNGNANGNPAHYNSAVYENLFYSSGSSAALFGADHQRMQWALKTDLRGTVEQSNGLNFFNNTVVAQNGLSIDAVSGVRIYNNLFSLLANGSPVTTWYVHRSAEQLLEQGLRLNLGTPANPQPTDFCDASGDPALSTPPYVFTSPATGSGDDRFYCTDNTQWFAELELVDFNYYHQGERFRLNAGGKNKPSLGRDVSVDERFGYWSMLLADETVGLNVDRPDSNSMQPLIPDPQLLQGVTLEPGGKITVSWAAERPFDLSRGELKNTGRTGGVASGAPVNIGAFPTEYWLANQRDFR